MKANIPLADVEMTLNERQQGTFAGTSRPADTQHLTGFQGEIDVFQRRMVSLRIRELVNIYIQFATPFRHGFATIVHHRRFRQHRANTAVRSTTNVPTMLNIHASASIGQIIRPKYIIKLVSWPSVKLPCTTIQLPPPIASKFAIPIAI